MSDLFSPYSIQSLILKNRIVIAPMCQYSAINGNATDWHLMHLGNLALSGAGLLIIEATAIDPIGRITPQDLGLWSDETELALKNTLNSIRKYSSMPIAIQIAHAGRKASCAAPWNGDALISIEQDGWQTVAPSAIPFNERDTPPRALTKNELSSIKESFLSTAKRAINIGVNAIEVHAAHGYLLHEFLSPLSNHREDEYGGSLENRMRFPLEVFEYIRQNTLHNIPIGIRISASDWVDGGWDIAQSIEFAIALEKLNCAFIHVSSGGLSPQQKIPVEANYQVPFAEAIKKKVNMPVIAVGLITKAQQAEAILENKQADLISLARGMLYDPRWPWHAAAELNATVDAPPQYLRCQPRELKNLFNKI